jgi:germination protein M
MNIGRLTLAIIVGVCAVALGWGMMTLLSRVLRTSEPVETNTDAPVQPPPSSSPAVPRIQAKLFFISEDGQRLVATEREVPLAEGVVAQARALVDAQLAAEAAPPLARSVPEGTVLRGLYVSSRNEIFVDLDGAVRARHPGGSLNELLTVYAIVNAITVNLPDVQEVQLLIDGREVDTLAGHVDLRQPLRKNESLIQQ